MKDDFDSPGKSASELTSKMKEIGDGDMSKALNNVYSDGYNDGFIDGHDLGREDGFEDGIETAAKIMSSIAIIITALKNPGVQKFIASTANDVGTFFSNAWDGFIGLFQGKPKSDDPPTTPEEP